MIFCSFSLPAASSCDTSWMCQNYILYWNSFVALKILSIGWVLKEKSSMWASLSVSIRSLPNANWALSWGAVFGNADLGSVLRGIKQCWRRCRDFSVSSDCTTGFVSLFECQRWKREEGSNFRPWGITPLDVRGYKLVYQFLVHHSYLVISQHI